MKKSSSRQAVLWAERQQTFHLGSAVLLVSNSMLNSSCWLWEKSSTLPQCKIKQITSQIFPTCLYLIAYFHAWQQSLVVELSDFLGQSGSHASLLPAGPAWLLPGPSWEPSMAQDNSVLFDSMYVKNHWGCGAFLAEGWGLPLHAVRGCREILGSEDVYLHKTGRPEHRDKQSEFESTEAQFHPT